MAYVGETIEFGPHKIEIEYSPTGYYSPWHAEEYKKQGKTMFCTADVAYFMRVDGRDIYKIQYSVSDVTNALNKIAQNYDFYPAEMEESFKEYLTSDDFRKEPDIE